MSQQREGGCLCGSVRYRVCGEPRAVVMCHCTHCQRQTGSVFSLNVVIAREQFALQGTPRKYQDTGDSGLPVWRHFCGECGSPLFTLAESMPAVLILKAGTLDDPSDVIPSTEVYAVHAAKWLSPIDGTMRFDHARKQ